MWSNCVLCVVNQVQGDLGSPRHPHWLQMFCTGNGHLGKGSPGQVQSVACCSRGSLQAPTCCMLLFASLQAVQHLPVLPVVAQSCNAFL